MKSAKCIFADTSIVLAEMKKNVIIPYRFREFNQKNFPSSGTTGGGKERKKR
jgi:hypothetical protein